jgi:LysM repeat protein
MKKFIAVILTLVTVVTSFCAFGATGASAEKLYKYKGYVYRVAAGDSMYGIAQRFGIRLKNLYKMNDLSPDYVIQVGDPLRLR